MRQEDVVCIEKKGSERQQKAEAAGDGMKLGGMPWMSLWFVHHQECVVPRSSLSYTDFEWD